MSSSSSTAIEIHAKFHRNVQIPVVPASNSGLKLLRSLNKTYAVYYFCDNGEKVQISIDLPTTHTVSQAILSILPILNRNIPSGQTLLRQEPQKYNLHFTKKNGNAKDDLPAMDMGLVIGDVGIFVFCLKEKEENSFVEDSDARSSIASANLNYQSPLKREIINDKRDLKLENKSFWGFFLCRC